MTDSSYIARNDASRERLQLLVARLTEEDLRRPVREGWTVSALLAHLAFWDRLRLASWEQNVPKQNYFASSAEQDMINHAALPYWHALLPDEAVRDALDAAKQIDAQINNLPPDWVAFYLEGSGEHGQRMLDRSIHRHRHLDEIEQALGLAQAKEA